VTDADAGATPAREDRLGRQRAGSPPRRGTAFQRLRATALTIASRLACRLPETPQVVLAELAGRVWYRLAPDRADQARRNLRRIVEYLVGAGTTDSRLLAASTDPRALEGLVRSAFRHNARYYLDVIRAPGLTSEIFEERLVVETPETVAAAFADPGPKVFITGHLGPIEMPGLYLARRSGRRITAPMEAVNDPALQGWFERTRASFGVRIVGLREARRELLAELRRGESVGIVADRDITGGGIEVPFFGAPAALPIGPALLAVETGAPIYMAGVWREGRRGYRGRLIEVPVVREGPRRAQIAGTLAAEARAFEEVIGRAPEQWGAIFFQIWPDIGPATVARREAAS
jgi:lauroyl/myristoyl acyltransferase